MVSRAKRIVIIGAGPGGLASAMLLRKSGFDVTVLERLDRVGGRTSAIEADGYRFDMGPTFFLYPQVLEEIFDLVGHDLRSEVDLRRLDPQYHLIFEQGGRIDATADIPRMQQQLAKLNAHDAAAFPKFLEDNRAKLEAFKPILQSPFNSVLDSMKLSMMKMLPLVRPWATVDGDLRRHFDDPRIRLAFSFQSKYLGMSPFQCPSLFTILSFLEYEYGVFHPIGGCSALSEAMARIARQMGVKIHLGEPVEQIMFDGRRARGVRTPERSYNIDGLVINADFARAMETLVPDLIRRRWKDRKLKKKKFSCSTFMMYAGIEGRYDHLGHHTIFLAKDYQQNLREIEQDHVVSSNPSFYVQNASVTDPTLAPRGCSTLYILAPVTHEHANVDWSRHKDAFRAKVIEQMRKIGIDDYEDRLRYEQVFTPVDWNQQMNIHRGATFNLAHNLKQMLHLRPRNRFEDLDGVYLVGGGTHPGSGLPVIFESAKITSRLMAEDHGLVYAGGENAAAAAATEPSKPELVGV